MKTIVEKESNLSKYIFDDTKKLNILDDRILIGEDPIDFIINDLNKDNIILHENVDVPKDWALNKYFFINDEWIINESWVDPTLKEE